MKWAVRGVFSGHYPRWLAIWKREDISRRLAVNPLFSDEKIVNNFAHMDEVLFHKNLGAADGDLWSWWSVPKACFQR